jgi:hypothetical protein
MNDEPDLVIAFDAASDCFHCLILQLFHMRSECGNPPVDDLRDAFRALCDVSALMGKPGGNRQHHARLTGELVEKWILSAYENLDELKRRAAAGQPVANGQTCH